MSVVIATCTQGDDCAHEQSSQLGAKEAAKMTRRCGMKEESLVRCVCLSLSSLLSPYYTNQATFNHFMTLAEKIFMGGLCCKESFVISLIYIQRICKNPTTTDLKLFLPAQLLLVSVMVASKFLDDFYCRNHYFAATAGLSNKELNALELKLCFMLDFDLYVTSEHYASMLDLLPDAATTPAEESRHLREFTQTSPCSDKGLIPLISTIYLYSYTLITY